MKEINNRETLKLLAALDKEINIKCSELNEKHKQLKLKRLFLTGCVFLFSAFILQAVFRILNVNFILLIILYQILAACAILPVIPGLNKGEY